MTVVASNGPIIMGGTSIDEDVVTPSKKGIAHPHPILKTSNPITLNLIKRMKCSFSQICI